MTAVSRKVAKSKQEPEEKLWEKKNLLNAAINSCVKLCMIWINENIIKISFEGK